MSCKIPAIENRYRESNPELADKLNQQTFDTWNTLLDSKLFEEKDNELYVNKEGTKKRVKQNELIDSINGEKDIVQITEDNKVSVDLLRGVSEQQEIDQQEIDQPYLQLADESSSQTIKPGVQELFNSDTIFTNQLYESLGFIKTVDNPAYSAVFFDVQDIISKYKQVHPNLYSHHSTIEFKPSDISNLPIGESKKIKILGRLTTDKVDVLIVENTLSKNKFPHITLSTAEGVKPFESNAEIEKNQDKIKLINDAIEGVVGVFDGESEVTNQVTPQQKQQALQTYSQYLDSLDNSVLQENHTDGDLRVNDRLYDTNFNGLRFESETTINEINNILIEDSRDYVDSIEITDNFNSNERDTVVTLIVKPLAFELGASEIIKNFINDNADILEEEEVFVDSYKISQHYSQFKNESFFSDLIEYYTGKKVKVYKLKVNKNNIEELRRQIGESSNFINDKTSLRYKLVGEKYFEIKDKFGVIDNGIHFSDSSSEGLKEANIWFGIPKIFTNNLHAVEAHKYLYTQLRKVDKSISFSGGTLDGTEISSKLTDLDYRIMSDNLEETLEKIKKEIPNVKFDKTGIDPTSGNRYIKLEYDFEGGKADIAIVPFEGYLGRVSGNHLAALMSDTWKMRTTAEKEKYYQEYLSNKNKYGASSEKTIKSKSNYEKIKEKFRTQVYEWFRTSKIIRNIEEQYKVSEIGNKEFNTFLDGIGNHFDENVVRVVKAPLKSIESLQKKADLKYRGRVYKATDIVRATLVIDKNNSDEILNFVFSKLKNDFAHFTVDDYFKYPLLGYKGMNISILTNNDGVIELQINTPTMIYLKENKSISRELLGTKLFNELEKRYEGIGGKGHEIYDNIKEAKLKKDTELTKKLEKESIDYYSLKKDITSISNNDTQNIEKFKEFLNQDLGTELSNESIAPEIQSTIESIQKLKNNRVKSREEIILDKLSAKFNIPWQWSDDLNEKGAIKNGVVLINRNSFTEDTLFHEFAHPFVEYLYQNNKTIYTILAKNSGKVVNSLTGRTVREEVKKKYPDYSDIDLEKEIITEAIGLAAINQLTETNKTSFFDALMAFFKYLSNTFGINLDLSTPYKDIANYLFSDQYTEDLSGYIKGDYFQRNNKMTRDEVEGKFNKWNSQFTLEPELHEYVDTVTGEVINMSVTTDIIKPIYEKLGWTLPDNPKSNESFAYSAIFGTAQHNIHQYLINSNLNPDKSIKDTFEFDIDDLKANGLHIINEEQVVGKDKQKFKVNAIISDDVLEQTAEFINNYLIHAKATYGDDVHVFTEQRIYDSSFLINKKRVKIIGTSDVVLVRNDGAYHIDDWKTTQTRYGSIFTDKRKDNIDDIKKQAYKEQLSTYGRMIGGNFLGATAYPIGANLNYNMQTKKFSIPDILEFPHPDPLQADPSDRVLFPVVISGDESVIKDSIEELIDKLNFLKEKIIKNKLSFREGEETDYFSRREKGKAIARIIEDLQTRKSIASLVFEANSLRKEIEPDIEDFDFTQVEKAQEQITVFTDLGRYLRNLDNLSEADLNLALNLEFQMQTLSLKLDKKRTELLTEKGIEYNVRDLGKAEVKYSAFKHLFKGISTISDVRTISLFHKIKEKYFNKADREAKKDLKNLLDLEAKLKDYGSKNGLNILKVYHKFLQKDKEGKPIPKLLKRIQDSFYIDLNIAIESANIKNIAKYIDLVDFNEKFQKRLIAEREKWKAIYGDYMFTQDEVDAFRAKIGTTKDTDDELQKQMRLDVINKKVFNFKNNHQIILNGKVNKQALGFLFKVDKGKAFIKSYSLLTYKDTTIQKYYTSEYNEILNIPELKDFYDFLIQQNKKAQDLDIIDYNQIYTFVPSVIASTLEKAERGDLGTFIFEGLRKNLDQNYIDENTVSKVEINKITGLPDYKVQKLYQNNLVNEKLDEKGNLIKDYSTYSLDLGAIYALYSMEIHNYEAKASLQPIGEALKNLEKTKDNIVSNKYGNVPSRDKTEHLEANVDFVRDSIDRDVYGVTHASTKDIALPWFTLKKTSDENGKTSWKLEKTKVSGTKSLRGLVAFNSQTNLGLNVMSAAVTYFGGSINAYFEANRSEQFNKKDLTKGMSASSSIISKSLMGDKNLTFINLIDPMMENENLHRAVKLSSTKLRKFFNTEKLYEMMRRADRSIQYSVAIAVSNNYMVVNDDLVNITEHVRKTYTLNGKTYKQLINEGNTTLINEIRKEISKEVEKLKETQSIYMLSNMEGDNLKIPDNFTEELIGKLRTIIRKQNSQIIGNMSQRDKIGIKNYALGSALMQYRNWMPSLFYQRFGSAEMDNDLNRLNWGKTRTFISALNKDFLSMTKSAFSDINDISLGRIKEKYDELLQDHLDKGGTEDSFETLENFTEYYLANFRSQLKEIAMILSFLMFFAALTSLLGWDDEDKKKTGAQKFSYRLYHKLTQELTFFYSPTSFSGIVKNVLPVMSTIENVERLGASLVKESYYRSKQAAFDIDESKNIEENSPTKYLFRAPVLKEISTWMALFNEDFRKEYNIKL